MLELTSQMKTKEPKQILGQLDGQPASTWRWAMVTPANGAWILPGKQFPALSAKEWRGTQNVKVTDKEWIRFFELEDFSLALNYQNGKACYFYDYKIIHLHLSKVQNIQRGTKKTKNHPRSQHPVVTTNNILVYNILVFYAHRQMSSMFVYMHIFSLAVF